MSLLYLEIVAKICRTSKEKLKIYWKSLGKFKVYFFVLAFSFQMMYTYTGTSVKTVVNMYVNATVRLHENGGNKVKKLLVVVDMQIDFVNGSLGSKEAEAIVGNVKNKIEQCKSEGWEIVFTRDTHPVEYLQTQEGKYLPVEHCIKDTEGWEIIPELRTYVEHVIDKPTFGSTELVKYVGEENAECVELIGLCTDICVVSNALLLKANYPEMSISVDASCCAGVTVESHEAALMTMKMCQIQVRD